MIYLQFFRPLHVAVLGEEHGHTAFNIDTMSPISRCTFFLSVLFIYDNTGDEHVHIRRHGYTWPSLRARWPLSSLHWSGMCGACIMSS